MRRGAPATHPYLSPAFEARSAEDVELLRSLNGRTGFSLFWLDVVKPLLCRLQAKRLLEIGAFQAKRLLEIGAFQGEHTRLLLQYCESFDATLTVIEPAVTTSLSKVVSESTRVRLLAHKSQDALPLVNSPVDVVLLEGDLNYWSTLADLRAMMALSGRQRSGFPVVLVRATSWPYARRDMYYDPNHVPAAARHEYATCGMSPWSPQLEEGLINFPFANASREGGARNGVLTAVEDFMEESGLPLRLFSLPVNNGLGILYSKGSPAEEFVTHELAPPPALRLFLETCELARLNDTIRQLRTRRAPQEPTSGLRRRLARLLRRLAGQCRSAIGSARRFARNSPGGRSPTKCK